MSLKPIIFLGLLLFLALPGGGAIRAIAFIIAAGALYLTPLFQAGRFIGSFFATAAAALLLIPSLSGGLRVLVIVVLAALFALLLAVKNLMIVRRADAHYFLTLALLYLLYLAVFFHISVGQFWPLSIMAIVVSYFLFLEVVGGRQFIAVFLAFIAAEALWVVNLLPLGFLNAASVMTIVLYLGLNLALHAEFRTLTPRLVLADLTVASLLLVLIFAVTPWTI